MPEFDDASKRRIAKAVKDLEKGLRNPTVQAAASGIISAVRWEPFTNAYAGEIPSYGIIEITGSQLPTNSAGIVYTATRPSATLGKLYAVNSAVPVPEGSTGVCAFGGIVEMLYFDGTPALGDGYGVKVSSFALTKGGPRCAHTHALFNSTDKILTGEFLPVTVLLGKLDGILSQGGSQTVSVWAGAAGSEADTGWNVTAYDWLMKSGATAIASGKKVKLDWIGNAWYVVEAECQ